MNIKKYNSFWLAVSIAINLFFFQLSQTYAQNQTLIDEVAAVVGDKIILFSDIEQNYFQAVNQGLSGDDLRCEVFDQLLLEKMFLNQAIIDSVEIAEPEVESELENRIRYFVSLFQGDIQKLEEYYKKTVAEIKEDYREDVKNLLLARRMQGSVINNVAVTPSEVKAFFESIPKDSLPYFNAEIELGQIVVFPKETPVQRQAVKDQLLDFKRQVEEEGADFAKLAATYSEDPGSATEGGELGFMERGQLVSEFEGAAFRLKNDELSDVVETQFGLHLIQMIERQGDRINVRHILMKPQVTDAETEKANFYLDSVRQVILRDSLDFKDAVEKFSEDEDSKKTGGLIVNPQTGSSLFEMDQLDPNIYFAIDTMKQSEITKPIAFDLPDGKQGFRLINIYQRTQPHLANLKDDYNKVQKIVKTRKQQEALQKWLNRKIPMTFTRIEEKYRTCDKLDRWVKD